MKRGIQVLVWVGLVLSGALVGLAEDSEPKAITWTDLAPKVEFDDPFVKLEPEVLMDLGVIARVRDLQKRRPDSVSEGMVEEAKAAESKLKAAEVDVEGLFALREDIKKKRTGRSRAVNKDLSDQRITMPGYMLPLEYDGKKVTEFLLVPWVGACIHTPPPPPNQIVYVKANAPFASKGMFQPIQVTGVLKTEYGTQKLFLVDGASEIPTGYNMANAQVVAYTAGKKATPRKAPGHP